MTIDSGSVIQTDPSITRNNATDYGKIYRGPRQDGAPSAYFFTATSAFDTASGFDTLFAAADHVPIAALKFLSLTLAGNPQISTANGGALYLALISVGNLTSAAPGGTLTFAGIQRLLLATQNGTINLGPELNFMTLSELILHARGNGEGPVLFGSVTLGSSFDVAKLRLDAESSVRVNGSGSAGTFNSYAGIDFLTGTGRVTTGLIDITALNNIAFNATQFSAGNFNGITVALNAGNVLNIDPQGADQTVFTRLATFDGRGKTINLLADAPTIITFNSAATLVSLTAGNGGIQGANVGFRTTKLDLFSGGNINIYSAKIIPNAQGVIGLAGTINAAEAFSAVSDVTTGELTAGTSVKVGGDLFVSDVTAGSTIDVTGSLSGFGTATAGGDISANSTAIPTITSPTGVLRVGSGGIHPFVESFENPMNPNNPPRDGANVQHTITIDSIVSPAGIDFSGNQFGGISGLSSGGLLTINARLLTFDAEVAIGTVNFDGADADRFKNGTSPATGGNGGVFIGNATGGIFVSENISATTGLNRPDQTGTVFGGAGGKVTLDSSNGAVTVSSTIQVSSNDPDPSQSPPPPPLRRSKSGGDITLHSGLTSGTAITLDQRSRLLSFLDNNAPGPGGTIDVLTEGGNIFANGEIVADGGTINISNAPALARGQPLPNGSQSPAPLVSIGDTAVLEAETINITSSGDIIFGMQNTVDLRAITISLSAVRDITGTVFTSVADGPVPVRNSSGNVSITADGSISFKDIFVSRSNQGVKNGLNLSVSAGIDLSVSGAVFLDTNASGLTLGGNISVHSDGNSTIGNALTARTFIGSDTGTAGSVNLSSGRSFSAGNFSLSTTVASAITLQNGANILLNIGQDLLITKSDGFFTALVDNSGHIVRGGSISLQSGGCVMDATSFDFTVRNRAAGVIDNGANITINADVDFETDPNGSINLLIANQGARIGNGGNIAVTIGNNIDTSTLNAKIDNRNLGSITAGGNITFTITGNLIVADAQFIVAQDSLSQRATADGAIAPPNRIVLNANNITAGSRFDAYLDDSNFGNFPASGFIGLAKIHATNSINVAGTLNVLGSVSAGGRIFAGTLSSTDVSSPTNNIDVGTGGITRFAVGPGLYTNVLHRLAANRVTSLGGINFDGGPANGIDTAPGSGGRLEIDAPALSFAPSGADIVGPVSFNGGVGGGNGGTFTVNTTGNIDVGNIIEATSGLVGQTASPAGRGGTVNLNSSAGTVSVTNRIQVSSNDGPASTPTPAPPRRRSAVGGNINVTSGKSAPAGARTVAINVSNSGQLLSLLAAAPTPRPGGKITILATGANSDVTFNGRAQADGGTIDIRHQGDGGHVSIVGPVGNAAIPNLLSADVIKAGAFGANGQLMIGRGSLTADTLIRLYAPGSNGELIFIANTTLSSGSRIDLAAARITIQPTFVVTISGRGGQANIYTNNANYGGPGGSNQANGTFGGNGAKPPQPLSAAPLFDAPAPRPADNSTR